MSLLEIIKTRRSIRSFLDKPLSNDDVIQILDAGRLAPSGFNRQPWRFIYVNDPKVLRMVKNCSPGFYGDAVAAIVVGIEERKDAFERERSRAFHRENRGDMIGILDVGFAAENILLAAHALGLGGCAIASFNELGIKKVLKTPENWRPMLVISLGYTKEVSKIPPKKTLSDIIYINEYGKRWDALEECN